MNIGAQSVGSATLEEHDGFLRVALASLRADTVANFELHLALRGRSPVLYRAANLEFTQEDILRLTAYGVSHMFIPAHQTRAYHEYMEQHLAQILEDSELPMEFRTKVAYGAAQTVIQDILRDPRSKDMLRRSENLVENAVDFMFRESDSFYHLMSVMSFDYYTYTHSVNVMVFASALAKRLGFTQKEICTNSQGALLHDIGKSQIDPRIVNFRGKLSSEQWLEMKKHPVYGYDLVTAQGMTNPGVLDIMRHHHEKLTGSGYPDGLLQNEISAWVRICAIADIFDALTTRRSYREALDSFPGLRVMSEEMSSELDKEYFRVFVMMMGRSQ